jgi:hypothetical protein
MRISLKYACQHCTHVATGYYEGFLSSTTILLCDRCGKETYVHLDRPKDYEAKERVLKTNSSAGSPQSLAGSECR